MNAAVILKRSGDSELNCPGIAVFFRSKQASKPLKNKGLLLSVRNVFHSRVYFSSDSQFTELLYPEHIYNLIVMLQRNVMFFCSIFLFNVKNKQGNKERRKNEKDRCYVCSDGVGSKCFCSQLLLGL